MTFNELIKNTKILKALEENQYLVPTDIQKRIIPIIKDGKDVLGQSQTGTGKTLAFAGPILDTIEENRKTQTLILAPTRELALQIAHDVEKYAKYTNINVTCVYGSSSIEEQIRNLNKGVEIVIGTPGRVKDLIKRNKIKLTEIKFFVLDEADEMLSMGFQEELEFIFNCVKTEKQVLLFSATMPKKIKDIAEKYMANEYETISIMSETKTADNIIQNYYITSNPNRLEALARILDFYHFKRVIIFVRTKNNADELLERLKRKGYNANVIHGDIMQAQRIKTLDLFKAGVFNYLIATDVAARGIHVDDIELVVNYNLPESNEAYVHRIGRTGRANKSGMAITFINEKEEYLIKELEKYTKSHIIKANLPEKKDILENRLQNLTEEINVLKKKSNQLINIDDMLNSLSIEELKNIITNLLQDKLSISLGTDFSINITEPTKKKPKKRNLEDSVRIFLTIGKIDNINKRDLLNFIEKHAKVKQGTCSGVEIMTKFTFMNVKKDCYNQIFNSCNNTTYKNRLIRIEKAKN